MNSCSSGQTGVNDLFSGTAATLARCGVSAVAAMQFSISDAAAIAFARGFYTAIAHGRDVDEAARSGRISILGAHGSLEWVTPVLYVRGQARQLFNLSTPAAGRSQSPGPRQITPRRESPPVAQVPAARRRPGTLVTAGRSALRRHRRRAAVIAASLGAIAAGFLIFSSCVPGFALGGRLWLAVGARRHHLPPPVRHRQRRLYQRCRRARLRTGRGDRPPSVGLSR